MKTELITLMEDDENCCSILAYSKVADLTFQDARDSFKALGRIDNYGVNFARLAYILNLIPRPAFAGKTLARVEKEGGLNKGKFIVRISGHVFAIIDGTIYDTFVISKNTKIKMVYEKTPTQIQTNDTNRK